jgi:hypothetical protein
VGLPARPVAVPNDEEFDFLKPSVISNSALRHIEPKAGIHDHSSLRNSTLAVVAKKTKKTKDKKTKRFATLLLAAAKTGMHEGIAKQSPHWFLSENRHGAQIRPHLFAEQQLRVISLFAHLSSIPRT